MKEYLMTYKCLKCDFEYDIEYSQIYTENTSKDLETDICPECNGIARLVSSSFSFPG